MPHALIHAELLTNEGITQGEVSEVVETEFGFHVIRLDERRVVPFEEVRDDVLGEVVDLASALGRTQEWGVERMADVTVDTSLVEAWRRQTGRPGGAGAATGGDRVPEAAAAQEGGSELAEEDSVLVRWPDTLDVAPFTVRRLERYMETLRPENAAGIRQVDSAAALRFVVNTARTHLLLEHAEELGVAPSPSQRAAVEDRWRGRVEEWARAFGFETGQSTERVKENALQGLGAVRQSAIRARSELSQLSTRLRQLYPVERRSAE